jgi:mycobactin lysine-N-oxygenase
VAIAAKAYILRLLGHDVPNITIFEPLVTGAHWSGQHGYSDGRQTLCTPAERDLGFPYDRAGLGGPNAAAMLAANFSWQAYGVSSGHYRDWIDRGGEPPAHRLFAEYLA